MSTKSLPVVGSFDKEDIGQSVLDAGIKGPVELRVSSWIKQPSKRLLFESSRTERANMLFNSRTGYVGRLTKLQGTTQQLMDNSGTYKELKSKQRSYGEVWHQY